MRLWVDCVLFYIIVFLFGLFGILEAMAAADPLRDPAEGTRESGSGAG